MKRLKIGVTVLVCLLIWGIFSAWTMHAIHMPISKLLDEAADARLAGNSEIASALASQAQQRWERWHGFTAVFSDHAPIETIEQHFSQLSAWEQSETGDFAALCRTLAKLERALACSHLPTPENLLVHLP